MTLLMENRSQARKVRVVLWVSWVATAICLWWGWDLLRNYGLDPGDGGELRALPERIRAAGLVSLLGLLPAAALTLFARRYVLGLELDGTHLRVTTLGWGGRDGHSEKVPLRDLQGGSYFHGRMDTERLVVNAPWITLRVERQRLPYLLDLQAEALEVGRIATLLPSPVEGWETELGGHA